MWPFIHNALVHPVIAYLEAVSAVLDWLHMALDRLHDWTARLAYGPFVTSR